MIISRTSNKTPAVSIVSLCYNHEKFLDKYFEGILKQKTSFDYEVIIHDDASTDNSQEILKSYQKKYPDRITLILQEENQHSKGGKVLGKVALPAASGKYISFCECDDYFITEDKLQKQFDFMESHEDYALCCHADELVNVDGVPLNKQWRIEGGSHELSVEELIRVGGVIMPTDSMFFLRTAISPELPDFYFKAPVGDTPIMIFTALHGRTFYNDEIMAAYRTGNPNSAIGRVGTESKEKANLRRKKAVEMYKMIDDYTKGKYSDAVAYAIDRTEFDYYHRAIDFKELRKDRFKPFRKQKKHFWIKCFFRKVMPKLYVKVTKTVKD